MLSSDFLDSVGWRLSVVLVFSIFSFRGTPTGLTLKDFWAKGGSCTLSCLRSSYVPPVELSFKTSYYFFSIYSDSFLTLAIL